MSKKENNAIGGKPKFIYFWRVRTKLPERFRQPCAVLIRGKQNSCLVEFKDGFRAVTSRNFVRKLKKDL